MQQIGESTRTAIHAWGTLDKKHLGNIIETQQRCFETLGLSIPELDACLHWTQQQATCIGAKISGAGRGDAVIGFFEAQAPTEGPTEKGLLSQSRLLPIQIDTTGVILHATT